MGVGHLAYDGKLWALGYNAAELPMYVDEVWSSSDGESWNVETEDAGWDGMVIRNGAVAYDGKMWVVAQGGTSPRIIYNSEDGVLWTKVFEAGYVVYYDCNSYDTTVVFDDKMWFFYNGIAYNSSDGENWNSSVFATGGMATLKASTGVYEDQLWIMGFDNSATSIFSYYDISGASWTNAIEEMAVPEVSTSTTNSTASFTLGDKLWFCQSADLKCWYYGNYLD